MNIGLVIAWSSYADRLVEQESELKNYDEAWVPLIWTSYLDPFYIYHGGRRTGWGNPEMRLNEYQNEVARTADSTKPEDLQLAIFGLGIAGEAGEVADMIKKHVGHGHPLDKEKLAKELGDVLWYVAAIASHIGWKMSAVALANVLKLRKRYPNGFSKEASIARADAV